MKYYSFTVMGYNISITVGFDFYKTESQTKWADNADSEKWAENYMK